MEEGKGDEGGAMSLEKPDPQVALHRLDLLEWENRRWKCLGIMGRVLAGAAVVMGQAAPKNWTVEAEGIQLEGGSGKIQVKLALDGHGPPGVRPYGRLGKEHAALSLLEDAPLLVPPARIRRCALS